MGSPRYWGYNVPFLGGAQVMPRQVDERLIKNDLLQLIRTRPGERVYRPDYGTLVSAVVFENFDDDTAGEVRASIISAIENYEERVTVNDVTVRAEEDRHLISIVVNVSPSGNPLVNYIIELGINQTGQIQLVR